MFNNISKIGLIVLAVAGLSLAGCKDKTPNYPVIPSIAFKQFIKNTDGTAIAKFYFKDGDHDIGTGKNDVHDIFMVLYQKNGSTWDLIDTSGYSVPQMDKDGNRAFEGEIDVELFSPYALPPASKFLCYVRDRAGHISNKVWTDEIIP